LIFSKTLILSGLNNKKKRYKTKKCLIVSITIIFLLSSFNIISVKSEQKIQNILYVGSSQKAFYSRIQDAIDNASEGDKIFVFKGLYNETIIIDKIISLEGENKTNTIIDGVYQSVVVKILESNVKLTNFTIRNSNGYIDNAGVKNTGENTTIQNCIFYNTKTGLYLKDCSNCIIYNCSFKKNGDGIYISQSNNNIISSCNVNHNSIGVYIKNSSKNKIIQSYIHTNGISLLINNSKQIQIELCNISDNSINLGGIFLTSCKDVLVNNSIINHNGAGFSLYSSNNISIYKCELARNTHFAVSMRTASKNISIKKCNIINNLRYGIYIEKGNSLTLDNCNIYNNHLSNIEIKKSICDAKNNYWGSLFGPSFSNLIRNDKVRLIISFTKYWPWSKNLYENSGADWNENKAYLIKDLFEIPEAKIKLKGEDTDNDGLPDAWEEKYGYSKNIYDDHLNLDPDNDSLNNFEECYTEQWGSNPYEKDIFLEIDWMPCEESGKTNKPSEKSIQKLKEIFLNQNINLHVDLGDMGGGGQLPMMCSEYSFSKLRDLYWTYFLNNNISNSRKGIFHYGLICSYCPDLNFPFFGWDSLDSFAVSAQWLKDNYPISTRDRLIVGATVHHLGHSLELTADTYDGIDNTDTVKIFTKDWWNYRNYKSCMNYNYKYWIFTYSDGTHGKGDFDDWSNLNFNFFKNTHFEWPKI